MDASNTVEGGCLCGAVRYVVDRDSVLSAHNCHCPDCQKSTGGGYTTIFMVLDAGIQVTSGELKTYEKKGESGGWVRRSFCPECGSPVVGKSQMGDGITLVKAGSLDDSDWLQVASSFWGETARPWAPVNARQPVSDRNPAM